MLGNYLLVFRQGKYIHMRLCLRYNDLAVIHFFELTAGDVFSWSSGRGILLSW